MEESDRIVIGVAVNGDRGRAEHPTVPLTPAEIAADVARCAAAGATMFHFHARPQESGWPDEATWYAEALRRARAAVPEAPLGITSIRRSGEPVERVLSLLLGLSEDRETRPDLVSVNLGHIVRWEPTEAGSPLPRRTVHFPNAYEEIVALLAVCEELAIVPELGVTDLGFVSNAVALREDGFLAPSPWFLVELDSPAAGTGSQVAPSSAANDDALIAPLRRHFPTAAWAAHGQGVPGYGVLRRAIATGGQIRVGLEDAVHLPDGSLAGGNADLVRWAVGAAREAGRRPATAPETRALLRSVRR